MEQKQRDTSLDALKGLMIALVVLAHALGHKTYTSGMSGVETEIYNGIDRIITSFLMPTFIFLSGFFTRKGNAPANEGRKLAAGILIPFLLCHILHWVLFTRTPDTLFDPEYSLWYLLSLFMWRLLIRPLSQFKLLLPASIAAALLVGLTRADNLAAISRTVVFFPFYAAGYLTKREHIDRIRRIHIAWPISILLLSVAAVLLLNRTVPHFSSTLHMDRSYADMGLTNLTGTAVRLANMAVGCAMTFALAALAPFLPRWLARFGMSSMTIYLAQSFIVRFSKGTLMILHWQMPHWLFPVYLIVIVSGTALLFSSPWVVNTYNKTMQFIGRILMKDGTEEASRT